MAGSDTIGGIRTEGNRIRMNRVVWRLWPFLNWVLPALFVGAGYILNGPVLGAFVFLLASPVVVVASGLVGALPRFVLRRRGWRTTPQQVTWLLILNWWGWILLALSYTYSPDLTPSLLRRWTGALLSEGAGQVIFFAAAVAVLATWAAVLVLASTLRVGDAPADRRWTRGAWAAVIAGPVAIALAVGAGGLTTPQERDASGATVAEVRAMPAEEQLAIAQERYDAVQALLVPTREAIAETGWTVRDSGFRSGWAACDTQVIACYKIEATYEVAASIDASLRRSLVDALRADGWDVSEDSGNVFASDREGYSISVFPVDDKAQVSVSSPLWYGDSEEMRALLPGDAPADDATYAYDQWPPLS